MTSKEVKTALKAAKNALQNKQYADALDHCNVILEKEHSNYNGLVFKGLSLAELGQCEESRDSYRKAIACQPTQALAYQGLGNLYMKHWKKKKTDEELKESIEIYEKLLGFVDKKDNKKYLEILLALCESYNKTGSSCKSFGLLESAAQTEADADNLLAVHRTVVEAFRSEKDVAVILLHSELIKAAFLNVLQQKSLAQETMANLDEYVSFLQKDQEYLRKNISQLILLCHNLHAIYPEEHSPLEIIVQSQIQKDGSVSNEEFKLLCEKLQELGSSFADMGLGFIEFKNELYEEAEKRLQNGMKTCLTFLPGWLLLCQVLLKQHKYSETEKVAKSGLLQYKSVLSSNQTWKLIVTDLELLKLEITKCFAQSLCQSYSKDNVAKGIGTYEKLIQIHPQDISLLCGLAIGLVHSGRYDDALDVVRKAVTIDPNDSTATLWMKYIEFKLGSIEPSIAHLQNSPPTALSLLLLGKCLWDAGSSYRTEKKHCFTALVKAAKLDPYNGEIFLLLGHFYNQIQKDVTRAKSCYQKAYQIDPLNDVASSNLADIYITEGDTESAIALYESITNKSGSSGSKWAWLRLGLCKLKAKDIISAIQCFQITLRMDPNDSICWECLGQGYLQRGSYTAASKAFERAHTLNPNAVYSLYQMATVKQIQGFYTEAIEEYLKVLNLFPKYVPALKGLGESEVLLAQHRMNEGRFWSGIEHVQNAIQHLTQACTIRGDMCCLWKLLADCCLLIHPLDGSIVQIQIPLVLQSSDKIAENGKLNKKELLALGSKLYCRAVRLQPENASLWQDLGISYFRRKEEGCEEEGLEKNALDAIKKAIFIEPTNHVFWCSLGTVAASKLINNPSLAQHCFLKSIECERNNSHAWNNLAALYLSHNQVSKAHEAFKVAQSLEPSFANSWIGQAIIAESIGSEDTMDLYRHSTELGLHSQASSGYSSWVVRVMSDLKNRSTSLFRNNIKNMNAVAAAVTQMSKQSDRNPTCPWSSNTLGYLLEVSGLNRSAEEAYRLAHKSLLRKDKNQEDDNATKNTNKVAGNFARILCRNGKYKESIAMYQTLSPLNDFSDVCGLALAFYKADEYKKAIEFYKQAAQLAPDEGKKVQVLVAMAMTFWAMQRPDEVKTLLFKCFQSSKNGLQALCALGIAKKDQTLVGAAVNEILKQLSLGRNDVADDCILVTAAAIMCGERKQALTVVQKAIRRYPDSWALRSLLCRLLVSHNGFRSLRTASAMARQAQELFVEDHLSNPLDRDSELWRGQDHHIQHAMVSKVRAISTVAAGQKRSSVLAGVKQRFLQAQTNAHMHPYESSSWTILRSACHAYDIAKWLSGNTEKASSQTEMLFSVETSKDQDSKAWSDRLTGWSRILNSKTVHPADKDGDTKFLKSLQQLITAPTNISSSLKNVCAMAIDSSQPACHLKVIGQYLLNSGYLEQSRKVFRKALEVDPKNIENSSYSINVHLFLLSHIALRSCRKEKDVMNEWKQIMKAAVNEMVKSDSQSLQSLLLQALLLRAEKNHRKSKTLLNRIVNSTCDAPDDTKKVAIWYLYRTLYERNDVVEIEKLISKAGEVHGTIINILQRLLPSSGSLESTSPASTQPSPEPSPAPERRETAPPLRQIKCKHYQSSCSQVCASCSEIFPCKYCHDEFVTSHQFDRTTVQRIVCNNCGTDQSVSIMCVQCETVFGKYFCDICHIFDHRNVQYYHCYHCGICQKGEPDKFFHCMKCDSCLSLDGFDTHSYLCDMCSLSQLSGNMHSAGCDRCIENSNAKICPICLDETQTTASTVVLLCGHSMHTACHHRLQQSTTEPKCPVCRQAL